MTDAPPHPDSRRLLGAWRLATLRHLERPAGSDIEGADGLIIYEAGGFMSAHIQRGDEHHAYFGPFTVDPAARTVIHHRLVNTDSGAPADVVRGYEFLSDDELVLAPHTPPAVKLTFRRVKAS